MKRRSLNQICCGTGDGGVCGGRGGVVTGVAVGKQLSSRGLDDELKMLFQECSG